MKPSDQATDWVSSKIAETQHGTVSLSTTQPNKPKKHMLHRLNPMSLFLRRRGRANRGSDASRGPGGPVVRLADDFDPRIRGPGVHDFSAPKLRSALPGRGHVPHLLVDSSNGEGAATPPPAHSPTSIRHDRSIQIKENCSTRAPAARYQHDSSTYRATPSSTPHQADLASSPESGNGSRARTRWLSGRGISLSGRSLDDRRNNDNLAACGIPCREGAAPSSPATDDSFLDVVPFEQRLSEDCGARRGNLSKNMRDTTSRFSFDMEEVGSTKQELLLEDNHRKLIGSRIVQSLPATTYNAAGLDTSDDSEADSFNSFDDSLDDDNAVAATATAATAACYEEEVPEIAVDDVGVPEAMTAESTCRTRNSDIGMTSPSCVGEKDLSQSPRRVESTPPMPRYPEGPVDSLLQLETLALPTELHASRGSHVPDVHTPPLHTPARLLTLPDLSDASSEISQPLSYPRQRDHVSVPDNASPSLATGIQLVIPSAPDFCVAEIGRQDSAVINDARVYDWNGDRSSMFTATTDGLEDEDDLGLDNDPIIAAANAEALANDAEGLYGQEFGFYACGGGASDDSSALGGIFNLRDPSLHGKSHSGNRAFEEPNLTPITERSEYSTRNSFVWPPYSTRQSAHSLSGTGLAQLAGAVDLTTQDDLSLATLQKLRNNTLGGSSGSLQSAPCLGVHAHAYSTSNLLVSTTVATHYPPDHNTLQPSPTRIIEGLGKYNRSCSNNNSGDDDNDDNDDDDDDDDDDNDDHDPPSPTITCPSNCVPEARGLLAT